VKRGRRYYCVYLAGGDVVYLWADDDYEHDSGVLIFGNDRGDDDNGYDSVLAIAPGQWVLFFEASETGAPLVESWESGGPKPHENLRPAEFRFRGVDSGLQ